MPLFTYVMSYRGKTVAKQLRKSNFTGWLREAVAEAFPELGRSGFPAPKPVTNLSKVWTAEREIDGDEFVMHIVETRD